MSASTIPAPVSKVTELESLVSSVQGRIEKLEKNQEIDFPKNYSVGNALRSAWLIIQETKDMNNHPALEVRSRESVCNALFNTVVQGLNPAKKQIYYIVYGDQLIAQRSYFGTMTAVKRLHEVKDVWADVVYKGDVFKTSKQRGSWRIEKHESSFENINPANIVAAYCVIELNDGGEYVEIMNMSQIQTSWNKSRAKGQSVHKDFPDQMAKRSVINRACKYYVNTSDDSDIFTEAFITTSESYQEESTPIANQDSRLNELNEELKASKQIEKGQAVEVLPLEMKEEESPETASTGAELHEDELDPDWIPIPKPEEQKEGKTSGQLCFN